MEFRYRAIGIVHSCFKEKFGIPRQAGLVPDARGTLELFTPYNRREYLEGLEGFSHIWLQYALHAASMASHRSKVRPPRLGGNQRLGVFGTRSNFRPNPIGLSLVTLEDITYDGGGACLRLKGIDLLDQTPVLDIKPYLPYADNCPEAVGGYAGARPVATLTVRFADRVRAALRPMRSQEKRQLARLLVQILRLDPRPAYYGDRGKKQEFGMHLLNWNVRWRLENRIATVTSLDHQSGPLAIRDTA